MKALISLCLFTLLATTTFADTTWKKTMEAQKNSRGQQYNPYQPEESSAHYPPRRRSRRRRRYVPRYVSRQCVAKRVVGYRVAEYYYGSSFGFNSREVTRRACHEALRKCRNDLSRRYQAGVCRL